jgi:hypothetical protein
MGQDTRPRARVFATVLLTVIPVLLLVAQVTAWLRTAVDLPYLDDWRAYFARSAGSFDPSWLLASANDTLAPVGKALDSIAQVAIGGNSVTYQLLSMIVVLGLLMSLQWTLLRGALTVPLHVSAAFVLTALMMRADNYWGNANLAYHQAIPLICMLGALVAALKRGDGGGRWLVIAGFALGLTSGFSYISGAFGAVAAGTVMAAIGLWASTGRGRSLVRVGVGVAAAGAITTATQLMAVGGSQGLSSSAGNPITLPWSPDFWLYLTGKVGASLVLPPTQPALSLLLTGAGVVILAISVLWSLRALRRPRLAGPPDQAWIATVLLTLAATVSVYLLLVAAGRASLRPDGVDEPLEVFALGFGRFHFFWVTVLWPWVGALAISWWVTRSRGARRTLTSILAVGGALCGAILVVLSVRSVAVNTPKLYAEFASGQVQVLRCLQSDLQGVVPRTCLLPIQANVRDVLVYAKSIDASFSRYVQTLPDRPAIEPIFSLHDPTSGSVEFSGADVVTDAGGAGLTTDGNAHVIVSPSRPQALRSCRIVEVRTVIRPSVPDSIRLFSLPSGMTEWSDEHAQTVPIEPAASEVPEIAFEFVSESGFEPMVRLDLGSVAQTLRLDDLEIRCRDPLSQSQ